MEGANSSGNREEWGVVREKLKTGGATGCGVYNKRELTPPERWR